MKTFFVLLCFYCPLLFAQDTIKPAANLILKGIPPLSSAIEKEVHTYLESRSAIFCDWHPKEKEMIISTRFGNVPQLHLVSMPLGERKQLTFFNEPVTNAAFEPAEGNYFLFTKDEGGNEFTQIYRYDLKTGKIAQLTDGKRAQNGGIVWSNKGKEIAYASTRRNGTDRDIYLMNPLDTSSNKMLVQVTGGGWGVQDWSKDDKQILLLEYISANESHLWLADVLTGARTELTLRSERGVAYGEAKFSKDEKGVYLVTDKENEFSRLAYMDIATRQLTYLTSAIPWNVEEFDLSKDNSQLVFSTNEAGFSKVYLLNTGKNQYRQITTIPPGVYSGLSYQRTKNNVAVVVNSAQSPADVYVISTSNGKTERWTESEMGGVVSSDLVAPQLIKWPSFDREEISGFHYKPASNIYRQTTGNDYYTRRTRRTIIAHIPGCK